MLKLKNFQDGTTNSATQRAYSKGELQKALQSLANGTSSLRLDTKYYLAQQVHPVVTRLCEPIEGIDGYHIAQCLGLDPTGFRHKGTSASGGSTVNIAPTQLSKQQKKIESYMNELEKFNNCVAFKYVCPNCRTEQSWQSLFVKATGGLSSSSSTTSGVKSEPREVKTEADCNMDDDDDDVLLIDGTVVKSVPNASSSFKSSSLRCILDSCSNPSCKLKPLTKLAYVKNLITLQLHKFIKQYYQVLCAFYEKHQFFKMNLNLKLI